MRKFQRILFLVAILFLVFFTLRHVYMRFLQPKHSVLDRFEKPMKNRISSARSLEELVTMYEEAEKKVNQYKAELKKLKEQSRESGRSEKEMEDIEVPGYERNPSEDQDEIREAIREWEHKREQSGEIYYYWLAGLILVGLGYIVYLKHSHWMGTSLWIAGFGEMIYWSSPTFLGSGITESQRLLTQKTLFSLATLLVLLLVVELIGILKNSGDPDTMIKKTSPG